MNHHSIKRCLIALLCTLLFLSRMTLPALAEPQHIIAQYIERSWSGMEVTSEEKRNSAVVFPQSLDSDELLAGGFYVVNQNITIDRRISFGDNTWLILADGYTLTVKGLYIPKGKKLTIYGQENDTGKLVSIPKSGGAGIGATRDNHPGGSIEIHGGTIVAEGDNHCAGIGSNDGDGTTSPITIYGGTVTANGGSDGAGIGGGRKCDGGKIKIYGGVVTAKGGGENGAGIGGGDSGNGGTIEIFGGTITVNEDPNEDGAGIGGGDAGDGGTITIRGGKITAWSRDGAGIGGGDDGDSGTITISGGEITCWDKGAAQGARIGGGSDGDGETITISGGKIDVYFRDGAGIGGGEDGDGGKITISGGSVYTHPKGKANGAGIGGGNHAGDGGTITITGGYVEAESFHGAGIGGGREESYIQFPDNSGDGGKITIEGGEVHATSKYSFGIGCGGASTEHERYRDVVGPDINGEYYGSAGNITIKGENTKVYAVGALGGIGGDSGTLTIEGGEVHASGYIGEPYNEEGGSGHGIYMDSDSSHVYIRGGTVYADGYGYGSYPFGGEVFVGISTQASTVEITGGEVFASSKHGAGIGGVETDDSKMHGSLLISGPFTVVRASSEKTVGIGCSDWDNKKAKWTFGREATIEVTSGGNLDDAVRINEVGSKITAGSSGESAQLLTAEQKKKAHSTYKYRHIELCDHKPGRADESGKCVYCGGKDGHCYVAYDVDGDPAHTVTELIPFGEYTTPPEQPVREGYGFQGWYQVVAAGTIADKPYDFSTRVTEDITIRAVWTHQHDGTTFHPWYSNDVLPANQGNYYLTRDVKLEDGWTWNNGTLNLCLDGHTIRGKSDGKPVLSVASGVLNVYDEKNGAVTQTGGQDDTVHVAAGGVFNLYGGTISGAPDFHSGVAADGIFHMAGGAVSWNDKGVLIGSGGTFTVSGSARVTDNTRGNVWLQDGSAIQIVGWLSEDSLIGVMSDCGGIITRGLPGNGAAANFSSDSGKWQIGLSEVGEILFAHDHKFSFESNGSTLTAKCKYPDVCDLPDGKATLTVLAPAKKTYGDRENPEATVEGEIPGITVPAVIYQKNGVALDAAPENAGEYTASIALDDGDDAVTAVAYTIAKAQNPAIVVPTAYATKGQEISLSYYVKNADGFTVEYEIAEQLEGCSVENSTEGWKFHPGQKTGDCKVKVTIGGDDNYEGTTASITITVMEKNTSTLAIYMSPANITYGAELSITYDPNTGGEQKMLSYAGTLWNGDPYGPSGEAPEEAGEYTVSIVYEVEDFIYFGAQPFRIDPVSVTNASVMLDKMELSYTGSRQNVSVTEVRLGEKTLGDGDYAVSGISGTDAGEYTVTVTGRGNYTDTATVTWRITPRPFEVTVSMSDYVVGDMIPDPSVSSNPGGSEVKYYYNTGNSSEGGTEWDAAAGDRLGAGSYYMYAVISESGNYAETTTGTTKFTVRNPEYGTPSFIIPAGVTEIGAYAFENTDMTVAYVHDTCKNIGAYAFRECGNLRQIRIPGDCKIGENAFAVCTKVCIFTSTDNTDAKNYCDSHDNCYFVEEAAD